MESLIALREFSKLTQSKAADAEELKTKEATDTSKAKKPAVISFFMFPPPDL
uniref:Uncharacterized protein n=1 Tax=Myoviridae sp. ctLjW1 TaxID=2825084 RepID=A0A8S5PQE3_9CAUD|nr:MAG TPA: hypothetical protein [Myoviridae sp. ctLjW1]